MLDSAFWKERKVFVTGHTGFKGSWLVACLHRLQARTTGYALDPPTQPSLFEQARLSALMTDRRGDVRDMDGVAAAMTDANAEVVVHLVAQSLVRASYADPVATFATNVMGTANVLEAARRAGVRAAVIVTSDKCYENREWLWPYREDEPLGGHDPYSSSKACAELVAAAYRRSFPEGPAIATVRAGNVIGGGDWAIDRLVPDCVRAFSQGKAVRIRNPLSIRPWQHVLEPLAGYLMLVEKLFADPVRHARAWNFGPSEDDVVSVAAVVERLAAAWGSKQTWVSDSTEGPHEARNLRLDSSCARVLLGWRPRLRLNDALTWIAQWSRMDDARAATLQQVDAYWSLT